MYNQNIYGTKDMCQNVTLASWILLYRLYDHWLPTSVYWII